MTKTRKEQLENKLVKLFESKQEIIASKKYEDGFSHSYIDDNKIEMALNDVKYLIRLSEENPLEIYFYHVIDEASSSLHLRLFHWQHPAALSDILPMLENFNLRTESERTHKVWLDKEQLVWIRDFSLTYTNGSCDVKNVRPVFEEAFSNVYLNLSENDGFNKLVLGASLSFREVIILRTYAKYLLQIGYRFSQPYIEKALSNNPLIAQNLIALFKARHDPDSVELSEKPVDIIEQEIRLKLESVTSLDEDRIINRLLDLLKATVRTNYFQQTRDNKPKNYLAIKLDSTTIPELPLPKPLYEIFVYSLLFEGIHLRKERVARGGIRWSERREDFRTEILGLMKAQVVKNTVIVPSGAKGGFVLKTVPVFASRDYVQSLVIQSYKSFISALLDLTDNIKNGTYIAPPRVVCYDEIDPYLVVAADKGTATFSDTANSLSKQYDFWLGDAFASGGSDGYDHKKMGITARGAWESIKRHFRELEYDVQKKDITVIGIGDMSGDVLGNGMLYSRHIKLLGVFDHRHIFIDPNPCPETSYVERERLFNLPTSSWENYNEKLISPGGGVYARSLKSITLTPEMKRVFAVEDNVLTPNELIRVLLKAPVDLLFNGGIGTYVKSSDESQIEVGDRTNDYCRVNGCDLRCKVIGEGGNLGLTQLGRVEYALNGGLIYTDFIDNSAGVDCSDHEVNLKILLDNEVDKGTLSLQERKLLLTSLTEEVASLVLNDNQCQALVMSFSAYTAKKNIGLHTEYIKELEAQGLINRQVEFLPLDKELLERKAAGLGLTRPEIATLLAYTKIYIKQEILKSTLPEDSYLSQIVETAFPGSIRKTYQTAMHEHRLKRDIIATQLSNKIVNQMGITFVYRMQIETGASVDEIIRAYTITTQSFKTEQLQETIASLDFKISMDEQFEIYRNIRKLINLSTRWFLHGNYHNKSLPKTIEHYGKNIQIIERLIPTLMSGVTKQYMDSLVDKFIGNDISPDIARHIATYRAIYAALNIIEVATSNKNDLEKTAKIYFSGGERMNLVWFRDELASDTREDHWHALTRLTLRDELDVLQRALTVSIIKIDEGESDITQLIDKWIANNQRTVTRWDKFLAMLHSSPSIEYTMFFIAIRELTGLIQKG